jgi:aminopeptidase
MFDMRVLNLAERLIESVNLKEGDHILIECTDTPSSISKALTFLATGLGAKPIVRTHDSSVEREFVTYASKEAKQFRANFELSLMKEMQAYIAIRGAENAFEMADVPGEILTEYKQIMKPVLRYRVDHTKWCITRWPNAAMAQEAKMSTDAFEDFYFDACLVDYNKMAESAKPLADLMNKTRNVRIVAPGTDLRFSIEGLPAIPCCGEKNIPDGEVYTAPVKNSVNGIITYNTPTVYLGKPFSNISLVFENGKIVEAKCGSGDQAALDAIFNTDEGARFVGEFAMGLNKMVNRPMCDILFDEKIAGSIHFTPGNAYQDAFNGNQSAIHWDLVLIMTKEYGGGKVWFDDQLIQEDGKFVHPDLIGLN